MSFQIMSKGLEMYISKPFLLLNRNFAPIKTIFMKIIDKKLLKISLTYIEYLVEVAEMWQNGQTSTTGFNNGQTMLDYTADNLGRMYHLNETIQLIPEMQDYLSKLTKPMTWLTITEGWCGDASQVVPVFEKIATAQPLITHRIIFRDEHLDIIDAFLTDGARSIPKLIVLDDDGNVLTSWGPRPQALHDIVQVIKKDMDTMSKEEQKAYFENVKTTVHGWYDADKTVATQRELLQSLENLGV